jgi:CheY-like chemotaxis protein
MKMHSKTLLIVDDEKLVCDVLAEAFERAGYTARSSQSSEEALRLLEKESIPVMFLDLKLKGMNGMELGKRIREKYPDSILYAITAYGSEFELTKCCQAGFNGYFLKPVKLEDLYKAAQEAFLELERQKAG